MRRQYPSDVHGTALQETVLHSLVEARLAHLKIAEAWFLNGATFEAMDLCRTSWNGRLVFGRRPELERRRKSMINCDGWRGNRLRLCYTCGDRILLGDHHFRFAPQPAPACLPSAAGSAGSPQPASAMAHFVMIATTGRQTSHLYHSSCA